MKRKLLILSILTAPVAANAQDNFDLNTIPGEMVRIAGTLLGMYLFVYLLITLIRTILDYRLRAKMIDKGVPDEVVRQFLQPTSKDAKHQVIKWSLLLAGFGLGLVLAKLALPYGIHSIAIMAFSMAASLLVYYFFLSKSGE